MEATFRISKQQFNPGFMEKIKSLFEKSETITIKVSDEMDETEYLLSSEKNVAVIAESLQQLLRNETVTISEKDLLK